LGKVIRREDPRRNENTMEDEVSPPMAKSQKI